MNTTLNAFTTYAGSLKTSAMFISTTCKKGGGIHRIQQSINIVPIKRTYEKL